MYESDAANSSADSKLLSVQSDPMMSEADRKALTMGSVFRRHMARSADGYSETKVHILIYHSKKYDASRVF